MGIRYSTYKDGKDIKVFDATCNETYTVTMEELQEYSNFIKIKGYKAVQLGQISKDNYYTTSDCKYRVVAGTQFIEGVVILEEITAKSNTVIIDSTADEVLNCEIDGAYEKYNVSVKGTNTKVCSFSTPIQSIRYPKGYKHNPFLVPADEVILPEDLKVLDSFAINPEYFNFISLHNIEVIRGYAFGMNIHEKLRLEEMISSLDSKKVRVLDLTAFAYCGVKSIDFSSFTNTTFELNVNSGYTDYLQNDSRDKNIGELKLPISEKVKFNTDTLKSVVGVNTVTYV